MKLSSPLPAILGLGVFLCTPVFGQDMQKAEILLAQAHHLRVVEGDLQGAIALYRRLAESPSISRFQLATTLVLLAESYQLSGSDQAIPIYERILTEFGDQAGPFSQASDRLRTLVTDTGQLSNKSLSGSEHELMMSGLPPINPDQMRAWDYSPDGSRVVFLARPTSERKAKFPELLEELYIQESGVSRRSPLLINPGDWHFVSIPRWSPDGNKILYAKIRGRGSSGERLFEILDMESGRIAKVESKFLQASRSVHGVRWMHDSLGLVVLSQDGVRLIDLAGKSLHHYEWDAGHKTRIGNVSPDGRLLLFHQVNPGSESNEETDLWILNLEDGSRIRLSDEVGFEGWPVWGAAGKYIYYVSGPRVGRNIYRRGFEDQSAPEQLTKYSNASAIHPHLSANGSRLMFTLMKDNNSIFSGPSHSQMTDMVRGSRPMLSPSGDKVFYISNEPGRQGIWVQSIAGDDSRQLVSGEVITSYGPRSLLSPDGSKLAYAQSSSTKTSLFTMATAGGEPGEIFFKEGIRHLVPSWSPDSSEIAFSIDGDLYVIAANGGKPEKLASVANWESWNIEWSPDGRQLAAFAFLEGLANNHVMLIDRQTGAMRRLTPESEDQYKEILQWHPDGKRISYMYYNTGDNNGSRLMDIESGRITDFANLPSPIWDYIGIWGPDGRYWFNSTIAGSGNVWRLSAWNQETGAVETIRKPENRSVGLPVWNKDGSVIAWSETEPVRQMWMMKIGGRDE